MEFEKPFNSYWL